METKNKKNKMETKNKKNKMETKKEFEMSKRDGTKAKFVFVKPQGSVWHWDIPKHLINSFDGYTASLPLPDVNLDKVETLKECLDLIGEKRGRDWVGHIVVDLLRPVLEK